MLLSALHHGLANIHQTLLPAKNCIHVKQVVPDLAQ